MARPGIGYLDVAKAATQLKEQNINPTIEEVRRVIGSGSNSTITRYLREWKAKQGERLDAEKGLPASLLVAVKGVFEAIREEATDFVEAKVASCEEKVSVLQQERDGLQLKNDELSSRCQSQEDELGELRSQLSARQISEEVIAARLSAKEQEIKRLLGQLSKAQDSLEHYQQAHQQQRLDDKANYTEQIRATELRLTAETQKVLALQENLEAKKQAELRLEQEQQQLTKQVNMLAGARQENEQLKLSQVRQDEELAQYKAQNLKLQQSLDELRGMLRAEQEQYVRRDQQYLEVASRLGATQDKLEQTQSRAEFLLQEKAELAASMKILQGQDKEKRQQKNKPLAEAEI